MIRFLFQQTHFHSSILRSTTEHTRNYARSTCPFILSSLCIHLSLHALIVVYSKTSMTYACLFPLIVLLFTCCAHPTNALHSPSNIDTERKSLSGWFSMSPLPRLHHYDNDYCSVLLNKVTQTRLKT